jgi:GxxExxY protein
MESEYIQFEEPEVLYKTSDLIYKDEVFDIIGICMEIHTELGKGFNEVVYKDAMEYEFKTKKIYYEREKKFKIRYKNIFLDRTYDADFVYDDKIIVEVKAQQNVIQEHYKQTINYLAVSKLKLGLIINFGEDSLKFKRVIL